MAKKVISWWDSTIIPVTTSLYIPFARGSFFLIYFWFGILKILDTSPANPLVLALQEKTIPFLSFHEFIIFFALFEMLIGVLFLIPKWTRLVYVLFLFHMGMTILPLFLLPAYAWQGFLTPTLEGQYMLKNLILIALANAILVSTQKKTGKKTS